MAHRQRPLLGHRHHATEDLEPYVVARINPLRFHRAGARSKPADFDETIAAMLARAEAFDASEVNAQDVATTGGSGED
jgi:hypothetical protein